MKIEVIGTGKSIQEATENAARELGHAFGEEGVECEILELGKKAGLFRKAVDARVRLTYEVPEPAPKPVREHRESREPREPREPRENREPRESRPERQPRENREPREPRQPKELREPRENQPRPSLRQEIAAKSEPIIPEVGSKAAAAQQFVEDVLLAMGIEGTVQVSMADDNVVLSLCGADIGAIIGRRGGTLDALQYLTGLVANRAEGGYCRITLDCENYREKREHTLEALARRLASNVQKTGKPVTLEPMNPYERRIIHATVQRINGVTSVSIGDEPNRRVIIQPDGVHAENGEMQYQHEGGSRRRRDRYNGNRHDGNHHDGNRHDGNHHDGNHHDGERRHDGDRDRAPRGDRGERRYDRDRRDRQSQVVATKPDPAKPITQEVPDKPLYGRIDID